MVGTLRSPTWEDFDEDRLPYTAALAKEILRWRTVMEPSSNSHAPIRDDMYQGYFIPKGTQITCNIWAMHQNPREFPDPRSLRPERFLGGREGGLAFEYPNARGHDAFGWGHRRCSGQSLAEQGILLSVLARLLWAFRIEPEPDKRVCIGFSLSLLGYHHDWRVLEDGIMLTPILFS